MMKRALKIILSILVAVAAIPAALQALDIWRAKKEEQDLFED